MTAALWKLAVRAARDGSPRQLLKMLLEPRYTDSPGNPIVGPGGERPFHDLPDDLELREQIVAVLLFGRWPRDATIELLATRDGWGKKGKPALSAVEVSFAALLQRAGKTSNDSGMQAPADELEGLADALNIKPETLRKRIDRRRK